MHVKETLTIQVLNKAFNTLMLASIHFYSHVHMHNIYSQCRRKAIYPHALNITEFIVEPVF